ncbi:Coenzyme Q-binding protein COQ10 like protein, mitochondrial [Alteripontixanthobacter maritimus]|uniref:Coenzyme Q-binding protein COQ10 like protein, mitochondrial n=1 Tax=Alteripontixanthobacter maritimus TaxID=2161824 RepID=A0A369Q509_9SPHN|nr:type II toxin-antitoxin system RatA family toxin [Alteripontixanthobacter maritimus]RDC59981.1 Coenzyme Q-binding protein COQ10 like protein, mitochondrial [Alteripontixanthobacter maritimus]
MPGVRQKRSLPYSCEQMFDLVADVDRYSEFLPWVIATRVRSDDSAVMTADLVVGFKAIREKFTSRVEKQRPHRITVHYVDGPMRDLDNSWTFRPRDDGGCEVDFLVDFTFRNSVFEALAGQYFDRAFRKMVTAFEARADHLYGSNSSSAQSVA